MENEIAVRKLQTELSNIYDSYFLLRLLHSKFSLISETETHNFVVNVWSSANNSDYKTLHYISKKTSVNQYQVTYLFKTSML